MVLRSDPGFINSGAQRSGIGEVVIEKDVFIGPHCLILPNVRIGEGSVIKAGTVVSTNVPPFTFYGSSHPEALAKITVPLTSEHTDEEFIAGLRPIRKQEWENRCRT